MAADTRIYLVTTVEDHKGEHRLIRGTSPTHIRKHLTKMFLVEPATHDEIAELCSSGIKVEVAANE